MATCIWYECMARPSQRPAACTCRLGQFAFIGRSACSLCGCALVRHWDIWSTWCFVGVVLSIWVYACKQLYCAVAVTLQVRPVESWNILANLSAPRPLPFPCAFTLRPSSKRLSSIFRLSSMNPLARQFVIMDTTCVHVSSMFNWYVLARRHLESSRRSFVDNLHLYAHVRRHVELPSCIILWSRNRTTFAGTLDIGARAQKVVQPRPPPQRHREQHPDLVVAVLESRRAHAIFRARRPRTRLGAHGGDRADLIRRGPQLDKDVTKG